MTTVEYIEVRPVQSTSYRLALHHEVNPNIPVAIPTEEYVTRCGSDYHKFQLSEYEGDDCPFCDCPEGLRWCYRWCKEKNIPVRFHEKLDSVFVPGARSPSVSFDLNCYGSRVCRITFLSAKKPKTMSQGFKNKLISLGFFSHCSTIGEHCGFLVQGKMADMLESLANALCGEPYPPVDNTWILKGQKMAAKVGF